MFVFWICLQLGGGIALLYYGGDRLVHGAASLAMRKGLSRMTVGLTVVALGTSAPEFFVSLLAVYKGSAPISIGNILGSNIANIALILGVSALISPLALKTRTLRFEMPFVLGASLLLYFLAWYSHRLGRADGLVLLLCFVLFLAYCGQNRHATGGGGEPIECTSSLKTDLFYLVGGLAALFLGSEVFVRGAVSLARFFGVSELVIGLTVVALGTSLPELAASIMAMVRKQTDISVGNILGSNIFNILFVLGVIPTLRPLPCPVDAIRFDFPVMIAFTLVAFLFLYSRRELVRMEGAVLLGLYLTYLVGMVLRL